MSYGGLLADYGKGSGRKEYRDAFLLGPGCEVKLVVTRVARGSRNVSCSGVFAECFCLERAANPIGLSGGRCGADET